MYFGVTALISGLQRNKIKQIMKIAKYGYEARIRSRTNVKYISTTIKTFAAAKGNMILKIVSNSIIC
jgi:hypothetical protein